MGGRIWMRTAAAAFAVASISASAAHAAPLPKDGMTLQEVGDWLKGAGYAPTVDAKDNAVIFKEKDQTLVAFGGDCDNGRCQSLQFFYGIKYDHGVRPDDAGAALLMNGWNAKHRWVKGYADESRDLNFEMDFPLTPGGDTEALTDALHIFVGALPEIASYLDKTK